MWLLGFRTRQGAPWLAWRPLLDRIAARGRGAGTDPATISGEVRCCTGCLGRPQRQVPAAAVGRGVPSGEAEGRIRSCGGRRTAEHVPECVGASVTRGV